MAFESTLEMKNDIAKITLTGELDASVAQTLSDRIEEASAQAREETGAAAGDAGLYVERGPAHAGLRQAEDGFGVTIYVVGAQPQVTEPIRQTGFHHSVMMLDNYDAAVIEA